MRAAVLLMLAAACGGTSAAAHPVAGHPRAVAKAPPPAEPTFEFDELEVRIPAGDFTLEGTLSVPRAAEPRPAVLLVQGSGPIGRDDTLSGQLGREFGFDVPIFRQLADALARAGYVVLRYDKRSCTPDTGGCENDYPEPGEVAFDDFVADAQACLDWLRRRQEVERGALFYIGHSQGGTFAPELLTDNPDVRAGVMLAAPFQPVDALSAYQAEYLHRLLLRAGSHPLIIGIRISKLEEMAVGLRRLRAGTQKEPSIADLPLSFWRSWMDLGDAVPALVAGLDRPLLAISGDADTNVPPSETELWSHAFAGVANDPGHRALVVPCVTHAFNCLERIDGRYQPTSRVSGKVIEQVLTFLHERK